MRFLEICCNTPSDAMEAQAGGARRVELCAAIDQGGITPSRGAIRQVLDRCPGMAVHVLIRPRGGNFVYDATEIATMAEDIRQCRELGVQGVVFGALRPDGEIDLPACRRLMREAEGLSVTFHRAFDVCREPAKALETIIGLGCDRLLTSGQAASAEAGLPLLAELVKQARERILVLPGAGITPTNIAKIERVSGAVEFHSTARRAVAAPSVFCNPAVSFGETSPRMATQRDIVAHLIND